jgi:hypothetical protein
MSLALPPYLQALMLAYSAELHADAERYSVLIDELLREFGGIRDGPYPSLTSPEELERRISVREVERAMHSDPGDNIMTTQF